MKTQTTHLILADHKNPTHSQFLFSTRTHPAVDRMLFGNPPKDYLTHHAWLTANQAKTRYIFLVLNDTDELCGYCQLTPQSDSSVELGWVIHPNHQGKGYGKSSVIALSYEAQRRFPSSLIYLLVKKDNLKAIHLYNSSGFAPTNDQPNIDQIKMTLNKNQGT